MESTNEFVSKVKNAQAKQEKNKAHYGKGTPSQNLSTKQHTNNP
ncbi:DUF4023 family protein [Paenibacillus sp. MWE-103]|uniref:DUF4023 family protein n=1 Tax=Paenibacillus artemisiicola TaxID=1172618 RepID=A0ABS3W3S2_9BACL|nr:DUF4023 family protein [Paenibacillus artemisiicola]MBO7742795.1 DUF4023 family protein [Paenibacillus artemisiicola]